VDTTADVNGPSWLDQYHGDLSPGLKMRARVVAGALQLAFAVHHIASRKLWQYLKLQLAETDTATTTIGSTHFSGLYCDPHGFEQLDILTHRAFGLKPRTGAEGDKTSSLRIFANIMRCQPGRAATVADMLTRVAASQQHRWSLIACSDNQSAWRAALAMAATAHRTQVMRIRAALHGSVADGPSTVVTHWSLPCIETTVGELEALAENLGMDVNSYSFLLLAAQGMISASATKMVQQARGYILRSMSEPWWGRATLAQKQQLFRLTAADVSSALRPGLLATCKAIQPLSQHRTLTHAATDVQAQQLSMAAASQASPNAVLSVAKEDLAAAKRAGGNSQLCAELEQEFARLCRASATPSMVLSVSKWEAGGCVGELSETRCPQCGREFTRRGHLLRHMYTHADKSALPFQCPHCSHSTAQKTNLKTHIKRKHGGH